MDISAMKSYFDLLTDKFNSPYFTDGEVERFLNSAQIEFANKIVFEQLFPSMRQGERGAQPLGSAESTMEGSEALDTIIEIDQAVTTSAAGAITRSDIETALSNRKYMHILSVYTPSSGTTNLGADRIVRYVKHNDYIRSKQNDYKRPTPNDPVYRVHSGGIKIDPVTAAEPILLTLIRKPIEVSISGGIDCELPEFTHEMIVAIAVELAGIASRDEALKALNNDR